MFPYQTYNQICSKKNRRNKGGKLEEETTTSNDVVDAAALDQSVVPSSAIDREQLVKIKKAMEMLQLQVKLHLRIKLKMYNWFSKTINA